MTRVDLRSAKPGYDGPLLRLEDLSVRFEADHNEWTEVVRQVSFDLHAGERFALVGESGSGKTVTALSIMRLLADAHYSGRILFEDATCWPRASARCAGCAAPMSRWCSRSR